MVIIASLHHSEKMLVDLILDVVLYFYNILIFCTLYIFFIHKYTIQLTLYFKKMIIFMGPWQI